MKPIAPPSKSTGLLKKYNIAPAPECVARLGQLVSQRTADVDEIAKIVASDKVLKERVLRAASPRRGDPIEDVDQAILRCGVDAVLVLAMADPLLRAVISAFGTLVAIPLERVDEATADPLGSGYIASVGFSGPASGTVFVRMQEYFAQSIAGTFLGTPPESTTLAEISDILGEIANTIVGNFKSNLSDAGLKCTLSVPRVTAGEIFTPPDCGVGRHHTYAFRHKGQPLSIDIVVESTE